MVRPHASENCKVLATLFANTITVEVRGVAPASASVGRSGQHSIFEALSVCFPHASRDHTRTGLSLVELNKALEKEGFQRVRFRNPRRRGTARPEQQGGRKWRDPENQSFYRYGNRRWRDPEDPMDFEYLCSVWPRINEIAPVKCALNDILHYLREAIAADMDSEVIKRKMVGLSSTTASQATTPSCGSPVTVTSPSEDGFEESDGESDFSLGSVVVKNECWDAYELVGQEAAPESCTSSVPSCMVTSAFESSAHEMFPTVCNTCFERPNGFEFEFELNTEQADDLSRELMNVFEAAAPLVSCAGW